MEVWLIAGEIIRPDACRLFRSRPPQHLNPLTETDGMPGVAFQWMEVEGPLFDQWPPAGHQLLFGDLPLVNAAADSSPRKSEPPGVEVVSADPLQDADRLLRRFLQRVYSRPVTNEDLQKFLSIVRAALDAGYGFTEGLIAAYTAVLSSPEFLYLDEQPGQLSDRASAERLSYFLWNSAPDEELLQLAETEKLHDPQVLRAQTDRLLDDPHRQPVH